jgi:hypothetical protein
MTWYNADYRRRQIVAVNASGGVGSPTDIDIEFQVPKDWDDFWDNIRSDFKDVVVTNSQGQLATFARKSGANYSTRTLTLQVDRVSIKNDDSICVVYIYFYNPDETVDSSDTVTIDSPKNASVMLSAPHSRVVSARDSQNALDVPLQSFVKGSGDEVHVFWATNFGLAKRISPYNDRNDEEGIEYVQVYSYDSSGTNSTERYEIADTQLGNGFVRATYKGGSSGTDYAIAIKVYTTLGQLYENRAILRVIDLLP